MNQKIQYGVVIICLIIIGGVGFAMTQLPLWGWLPLPLLSAIWALIVFLRLKKYNLRWLLLSTLSGIFLSLGFPVSPLTPLLFLGFVPLLMVENEIFSKGNKEGILKYAYNAFAIWNIGATWWVSNAGLAPGMIANFLNAFFMAVPFWLFHKSRNILTRPESIGRGWHLGGFIIYWLAFEYVHLNWEISWSWLTLGNAFAQYPSWIQWYEYTGVFGGSLWILAVNILIFKAINSNQKIQNYINQILTYTSFSGRGANDKNAQIADNQAHSDSPFGGREDNRVAFKALLTILIPLSISALIANFSNNQNVENDNKTANVVVVQPNYEPHYQKFEVPEDVQLQKFLKLAAQKIDSTTDYLVFPETSFDFHNVDNFDQVTTINLLKDFVNRYPKLHLVTGIDAIKIYAAYVFQKPEGLASSVRDHDNRDGTFTYFEAYNAAAQITSGANNIDVYKKSKLVPGAEILPYGFLFGWLKPLFRKFGGSTSGYGAQPTRSVFRNKDGQRAVAPMICYESVFGDFSRGYVEAGANAFFVVTNDGWWDDTPGYKQHLKFACLRAIEFRRPVVRSANTGSSCFIDKYGHIEQATPYAVDAVIKGTIHLNYEMTFYEKVGDIIGRVAAYLAVALLLFFIFKSILKRFKQIV